VVRLNAKDTSRFMLGGIIRRVQSADKDRLFLHRRAEEMALDNGVFVCPEASRVSGEWVST
jgi:hypothetical protein